MSRRRMRAFATTLSVAMITSVASRGLAATVVVNNLDGAGEGFNDTTPVSPVGGNTGTTRGAQRLLVFQNAASIWGALLASNITISIDASFDPLTCTPTSAVLGSAGTIGIAKDFSGALLANHYYTVALANSLAHGDLDPTRSDIRATFNSGLGGANCLAGSGWYLGLDGNEGSQIDLLATALHEFAHGLGFITFANETTGVNGLGAPDAFESLMLDNVTGKHWDIMTNAERVTSAQHTRRVVWDGPLVIAAVSQKLTLGTPLLTVSSPPSIQGEYMVGLATFGPPLSGHPASGTLKLVQDSGGASTSDGCEPVVNGVSGAIVLIDRGTCAFNAKVKNAQNAGAAAVLIADNVAGSPPTELSGTDPTITIPSARITQNDGATFKTALMGGTVLVNFSVDGTRYLGADAQRRALIDAPSPVEPGSSLSHWDTIPTPNLLLEPVIESDLNHTVDLTLPLLRDIGWQALSTPAVQALPFAWSRLLYLALVLPGIMMLRRRRA